MNAITRRSALILPAAAIRGSAANSAVTVGVIGTGGRGSYVAAQVAKYTSARVTALCDIDAVKLAAVAKELGVPPAGLHDDHRRLLASNVDAVIIATPVFLHAGHFEDAVRAGKHIYLEKPASIDVEGCRRVIRAADSADRRFNITFGFQRRYAQLYRKAKKLADSGAIGDIRLGAARFIKSGGAAAAASRLPDVATERRENWWVWKDLSGDLIVENNVHSIDVLNWFLGGRPLSAIGAGGRRVLQGGDTRDHNFVAYTYPGGTQGQLSGATIASPGYRDVVEQFFGSQGMIETSENHFRHFRKAGDESTEKTPRPLTIDAVEEFVRRIAENRPENTAIQGAESTLTAILGRMAMDARREVAWDEMMKS